MTITFSENFIKEAKEIGNSIKLCKWKFLDEDEDDDYRDFESLWYPEDSTLSITLTLETLPTSISGLCFYASNLNGEVLDSNAAFTITDDSGSDLAMAIHDTSGSNGGNNFIQVHFPESVVFANLVTTCSDEKVKFLESKTGEKESGAVNAFYETSNGPVTKKTYSRKMRGLCSDLNDSQIFLNDSGEKTYRTLYYREYTSVSIFAVGLTATKTDDSGKIYYTVPCNGSVRIGGTVTYDLYRRGETDPIETGQTEGIDLVSLSSSNTDLSISGKIVTFGSSEATISGTLTYVDQDQNIQTLTSNSLEFSTFLDYLVEYGSSLVESGYVIMLFDDSEESTGLESANSLGLVRVFRTDNLDVEIELGPSDYFTVEKDEDESGVQGEDADYYLTTFRIKTNQSNSDGETILPSTLSLSSVSVSGETLSQFYCVQACTSAVRLGIASSSSTATITRSNSNYYLYIDTTENTSSQIPVSLKFYVTNSKDGYDEWRVKSISRGGSGESWWSDYGQQFDLDYPDERLVGENYPITLYSWSVPGIYTSEALADFSSTRYLEYSYLGYFSLGRVNSTTHTIDSTNWKDLVYSNSSDDITVSVYLKNVEYSAGWRDQGGYYYGIQKFSYLASPYSYPKTYKLPIDNVPDSESITYELNTVIKNSPMYIAKDSSSSGTYSATVSLLFDSNDIDPNSDKSSAYSYQYLDGTEDGSDGILEKLTYDSDSGTGLKISYSIDGGSTYYTEDELDEGGLEKYFTSSMSVYKTGTTTEGSGSTQEVTAYLTRVDITFTSTDQLDSFLNTSTWGPYSDSEVPLLVSIGNNTQYALNGFTTSSGGLQGLEEHPYIFFLIGGNLSAIENGTPKCYDSESSSNPVSSIEVTNDTEGTKSIGIYSTSVQSDFPYWRPVNEVQDYTITFDSDPYIIASSSGSSTNNLVIKIDWNNLSSTSLDPLILNQVTSDSIVNSTFSYSGYYGNWKNQLTNTSTNEIEVELSGTSGEVSGITLYYSDVNGDLLEITNGDTVELDHIGLYRFYIQTNDGRFRFSLSENSGYLYFYHPETDIYSLEVISREESEIDNTTGILVELVFLGGEEDAFSVDSQTLDVTGKVEIIGASDSIQFKFHRTYGTLLNDFTVDQINQADSGKLENLVGLRDTAYFVPVEDETREINIYSTSNVELEASISDVPSSDDWGSITLTGTTYTFKDDYYSVTEEVGSETFLGRGYIETKTSLLYSDPSVFVFKHYPLISLGTVTVQTPNDYYGDSRSWSVYKLNYAPITSYESSQIFLSNPKSGSTYTKTIYLTQESCGGSGVAACELYYSTTSTDFSDMTKIDFQDSFEVSDQEITIELSSDMKSITITNSHSSSDSDFTLAYLIIKSVLNYGTGTFISGVTLTSEERGILDSVATPVIGDVIELIQCTTDFTLYAIDDDSSSGYSDINWFGLTDSDIGYEYQISSSTVTGFSVVTSGDLGPEEPIEEITVSSYSTDSTPAYINILVQYETVLEQDGYVEPISLNYTTSTSSTTSSTIYGRYLTNSVLSTIQPYTLERSCPAVINVSWSSGDKTAEVSCSNTQLGVSTGLVVNDYLCLGDDNSITVTGTSLGSGSSSSSSIKYNKNTYSFNSCGVTLPTSFVQGNSSATFSNLESPKIKGFTYKSTENSSNTGYITLTLPNSTGINAESLTFTIEDQSGRHSTYATLTRAANTSSFGRFKLYDSYTILGFQYYEYVEDEDGEEAWWEVIDSPTDTQKSNSVYYDSLPDSGTVGDIAKIDIGELASDTYVAVGSSCSSALFSASGTMRTSVYFVSNPRTNDDGDTYYPYPYLLTTDTENVSITDRKISWASWSSSGISWTEYDATDDSTIQEDVVGWLGTDFVVGGGMLGKMTCTITVVSESYSESGINLEVWDTANQYYNVSDFTAYCGYSSGLKLRGISDTKDVRCRVCPSARYWQTGTYIHGGATEYTYSINYYPDFSSSPHEMGTDTITYSGTTILIKTSDPDGKYWTDVERINNSGDAVSGTSWEVLDYYNAYRLSYDRKEWYYSSSGIPTRSSCTVKFTPSFQSLYRGQNQSFLALYDLLGTFGKKSVIVYSDQTEEIEGCRYTSAEEKELPLYYTQDKTSSLSLTVRTSTISANSYSGDGSITYDPEDESSGIGVGLVLGYDPHYYKNGGLNYGGAGLGVYSSSHGIYKNYGLNRYNGETIEVTSYVNGETLVDDPEEYTINVEFYKE